jgi:hypothetical protein
METSDTPFGKRSNIPNPATEISLASTCRHFNKASR